MYHAPLRTAAWAQGSRPAELRTPRNRHGPPRDAVKDARRADEPVGVRRSLALVAACGAALPSPARASPRAVTSEDLLSVRRADVLPHGTVSSRFRTDYGERLDQRAKGAQAGAILTRRLTGEATFAVGLFDVVQLEAGLPLVFLQQGTALAPDGDGTVPLYGGGLGDVSFGAAATFLPLPARGVGLGAAFDVVAPTATVRRATYERGFRYVPQLTFSAQGRRFEFHSALGYVVRRRTEVGAIVVDDAVTYGLGSRVPLGRRRIAAFLAEASGEIAVDRRGTDPLEIRAAVEFRSRRGPVFVLGLFGTPLLGVGRASVGLSLAVGYAPPHRVGRSRPFEGAPRLSTPSLLARHRAFVPAEGSTAPRALARRDGDDDGDRIADADDACPHVAEDRDGFADADGCPDLDDDADGIADADDRCPREPEVVNGWQDADGCPDVRVAGGGRTLERFDPDFALPPLVFDAERSDADPGLRAKVAELAEILRLNPWIERLEIEVRVQRTDDPARAARLADLRARLLLHLLEQQGIDPARIVFRPPRTVPPGHPVRVRVAVQTAGSTATATPRTGLAAGYGSKGSGAAPR